MSGLIAYGPLVLGLSALLGAVGVPVATPLLVVAAGAFVRQGLIDWKSAVVLGMIGAILGENAAYFIGRYAGGWAKRSLGVLVAASWEAAQERFHRHAPLTVYLTRFLFTPLAVPTSLIAGSSGYTLRSFLIYALAGNLTLALMYGGLGYLAGSQWHRVGQVMSTYTGWLVAAPLMAGSAYYLVRHMARKSVS
jgi:membrane protein DedA with SNARE-associated domain